MKRNTTQIRVYPETKQKIIDTSRMLSDIQKSNVYSAEVIRRLCNIPQAKDILVSDARLKKELNKYGK